MGSVPTGLAKKFYAGARSGLRVVTAGEKHVPSLSQHATSQSNRERLSHLQEVTRTGALAMVSALLLLLGAQAAPRDLSLKLNKISQSTSPKAKCIDGTPPAYAPTDAPRCMFLSIAAQAVACFGSPCFSGSCSPRRLGPAAWQY